MQVFYDKTFTDKSNYVSEEVSKEGCIQKCLEDGNCDAFDYMDETAAICLLFQLQDNIMMEYSFNQKHIGSGQIQNLLSKFLRYRPDDPMCFKVKKIEQTQSE